MLVRTIDRTMSRLPPFVTETIACDDCRKESEEATQLGESFGDVEGFMAEKAGYVLRMRGSLRVALCPDCAAKRDN